MPDALDRFYSIIPAGGVGSRLWPLSRARSPKFLRDVAGRGTTLLRGTWDRLVPLSSPGRILVVAGEPHASEVRQQLGDLLPENTVLEPEGRDSAAAIGLAAAIVWRRDPDAIIGSFAADHLIGAKTRFHAAVREAIPTADAGYIATIGIQPYEPSTGFGYIRTGTPLVIPGAPSARIAESFVEKPDARTARRYFSSGEYLWNAGMFIARADRLLLELERNAPELAAGIAEIADAWGTNAQAEVTSRVWQQLPKIAIDYAVAEPASASGGLAVVPGYFQWDDVGDFAAVSRLHQNRHAAESPGEVPGLFVQGAQSAERVVGVGATGFVASESDRVIAIAGIPDIVVVDTPDALLVTTRAKAQDVKQIVQLLGERGLDEVL